MSVALDTGVRHLRAQLQFHSGVWEKGKRGTVTRSKNKKTRPKEKTIPRTSTVEVRIKGNKKTKLSEKAKLSPLSQACKLTSLQAVLKFSMALLSTDSISSQYPVCSLWATIT